MFTIPTLVTAPLRRGSECIGASLMVFAFRLLRIGWEDLRTPFVPLQGGGTCAEFFPDSLSGKEEPTGGRTEFVSTDSFFFTQRIQVFDASCMVACSCGIRFKTTGGFIRPMKMRLIRLHSAYLRKRIS